MEGGEEKPVSLRIGFIEPHLHVVGGVRRVIETSNRLIDWGHEVTLYVPAEIDTCCVWMPCRAAVSHIADGAQDELDFIVFNHEPQWYLLDAFPRARKRLFLALSYSRLYNKAGSWESLRADVDLVLVNSQWTAEHVAAEITTRPAVVPTGVNRDVFHPVDVAKRYPVLCPGEKRAWKGTPVIEEACRLLDLPVEKIAGKELKQHELATEFSRAEVFVVGSPLDGFGMPGLEALACGVPLVTTDNGGCREYAVHEETALIVPPDDPSAMAEAIARVRAEPNLARHLVEQGLRCAGGLSWDAAAREFEGRLLEEHARPARDRSAAQPSPLRPPEERPVLSIVVLNWNNLALTQQCLESIRQHTDVPYELIVVDNGSEEPGSAGYIGQAADVAILNDHNAGFSAGFNQGLARARGEYVAFINNDTVLPSEWAGHLAQTLRERPEAGIVFPAVTAASNAVTVRQAPAERITLLPAFLEPPSGVALAMRTDQARALEGWDERYEIASGEDTDLCFKVWVNGLTTVLDERVLVQHVNKASSRNLPNQRARWAENRRLFLEKWTGEEDGAPCLSSCPPGRFADNRAHARGVAFWMERYFALRERRGAPEGSQAAELELLRHKHASARTKIQKQRLELKRLRTQSRFSTGLAQWLRRAATSRR